jgi:DNA-binding transcriptional MocR family regulator
MTPPAAALHAGTALARRADRTLTEQLSARFAERIRQRLLAPGTRLPSVRECARRHGISPCTVVSAYDRLLAQGLIEARKQRGFFVREPAGEPAATRRASPAKAGPRAPLPINATMLIRGMFQPPGAQPMPGLGTLPAEWLDPGMLASALRKVGGNGDAFLRYGDPAGEARLREVLAARLAEHGVPASP